LVADELELEEEGKESEKFEEEHRPQKDALYSMN
jgi:hypothetical protein